MIRQINIIMDKMIKSLEGTKKEDKAEKKPISPSAAPEQATKGGSQKKTALQVINELVNARLKQPEVDRINDHGIRENGPIPSPEFKLLKDRGLLVLNVSITNLRFPDPIEQQIISQWKASWLKNAKDEEERINRQIGFAEIIGQEEAELKYANTLARHIMKQRPANIKETLQALLMRTRLSIVRDNQLQRRLKTEREDIEQVLQWMENSS